MTITGEDDSDVELAESDVVVNPLTTGEQPAARKVGYMPVKLGSWDEVWWALVDTGAQVSVISAGLASYLELYPPDMGNVHPVGFTVSGYNGTSSYMPVLETRLRLGARGGEERWIAVHLCILDTNAYKLIVGIDLLDRLHFTFDGPSRRLFLEWAGVRFSLPLATRQYAFDAASIKRYHQALEVTPATADAVEVLADELEESLDEVVDQATEGRYSNALSWGSAHYVGWEHQGAEAQLVPLLYLAEITGA